MIKLLEKKVMLKVRKEDTKLVASLIDECEKEFKVYLKKETQRDYDTKLVVIEDAHLTPEEGGECGGILMMSEDRKIVCINTMVSRLN